MHICMVVFTDIRYDFRVYREAVTLARAGHRVTVVSSAFASGSPHWDGVDLVLLPVDRARSLRLSYPGFWHSALPLLLETRADVYHAHDLDALLPAARAARRLAVPLVYDSHELFVEQSSLVSRPWIRAFWMMLEKTLIQRAVRVITVCDSIARYLERKYSLPPVHVVRNLPPYRRPLDSHRLHEALDLPRHRRIVLYQGGFLTHNGLSEQIQAAADFDDAVFVLLGSGPREKELRQLVRERGLADRVRFVPRVPFEELHAYTCSAHVGVCLLKGTGLSFYYSLPNKLFEYLMAGLPVVGSDFPEIAPVLAQGPCGIAVPPTDRSAVVPAINRLLHDRSLYVSCREAALERAREFNWETEATRLLDVYEGL